MTWLEDSTRLQIDGDDAPLFDREPALSTSYEQGPRWFIPGYDLSHAMAAVLLRDRIGDRGRILVVGAGGGVEPRPRVIGQKATCRTRRESKFFAYAPLPRTTVDGLPSAR